MSSSNPNKYDAIMDRLGYRYVQTDRLTFPDQTEIDACERSLGYPLPPDYKEFLRKYGVTGSEMGHWTIRREDGTSIGGVDVFFGISPRSTYDLQSEGRFFEEEDLPRYVLPIASSSGGSIVLSLAGEDCGSLYWWHVEEPFSKDTAEFLAASFDAFMNQLVAD